MLNTPTYPSSRMRYLLGGLLGLEVVVSTVGDGTTDKDDGVEADTEAAGGR